ncbi:MAG: Ig-like domain-containing protein [Lachnospira sp.]|nr:Ig-like domain-containing protein [Lachnospira sp.]
MKEQEKIFSRQHIRKIEPGRKKSLRMLSVILCICLMITGCPYIPADVVVQAAAGHSHSGWTAWNNGGAMPGTAGNYYLTSNVSLSGSEWRVPSGTTNLCLNGHTITQNNGARVLTVPSGATFNLYDEDNKGKITGGSAGMGGGISVEGTFTMNGGQVTGNTATANTMGTGGAGMAVHGGKFTMNGGSICNNHGGGFHGGGITVNSRGTVTMTGGTITGNSAGTDSGGKKRSGGGVYIESGSSFTMSGGEISGNTADDSGGGVNVDGTFTMSGGKITGNTAKTTSEGGGGGGIGDFGKVILTGGTISGNTSSYGGGVLYSYWSTASQGLTLSGSPVIKENKNPTGAADNLYVDTHKSKYITIGSGGLKEGAQIGVKTKKEITSCDIHDDFTYTCDNYSKYFVSDVAAYEIGYNLGKICLMKSHTYAYTSNGATITRGCKKCSASETATLSIPSGASRTYTGSALTPVTVTYSDNWAGAKPEVTYKNNINVGEATASLTVGGVTASLAFDITPAVLSGVSASGYEGTYDGQSHSITVNAPAGATVKYGTSSGSCTLTSSPTRKDVGTTTAYYQVTKTNYSTVSGSAKITITAKSLSDSMVTIASGPHYYTGSAVTPAVTVKDGSKTLVKGTDYSVSYKDNVGKGTAANVTVTGTGNYSGTVNKTFEIKPKSLSDSMVTIASGPYYYTGSAVTPAVTVKDGSKTLVKGTDYSVSYKDNVGKGTTASVTVTGTGNYSGTVNKTFEIKPKSLSDSMVTIASGPHYYTGSAVTPSVTVKDGSKTLAEGTDYTISYKDNVGKGEANVTVTGKGNYTGSIRRTFTIEYRTLPEGRRLSDYVTISPETTDGWYNADITLTPNSGCGVSVGEPPTGIGSMEAAISQETGVGGSTENIYVKDSDGNIYQTEFFYKLDKTAPEIDLQDMMVKSGTKNLWDWIIGKTSMIIQIPVSSITDNLSGIAEVSYTADAGHGTVQNQILQAQGDYYEIALNAEFSGTIQLTAKDNAGNTKQTSLTSDNGKVIAEDYAPVVTFALPEDLTPGEDGWYNTAVTVTVNVTDDKDGSNASIFSGGIAGIRWKEGENGEEQTVTGIPGDVPVYEKEFTISVHTDGTHTYFINAADNAGNESGWQMVTVKVDTELPLFVEAPAATNQTKEGADVIFTPSEGGKVYWHISDAGTPPTAQQVKGQGEVKDVTGGTKSTFTITGLTPGEKHTVYVVLEDAAGNLSEAKGESFFTCQEAPDIMSEQLAIDYTKETLKLPDNIGGVEVYTDPDNPSESKVTPNDDGSLPVTPGMEVYVRYPERTEGSLAVPASDKVTIQVPDRPIPTDKQMMVTDNAITLMNPDSKEEYVLVKKGENPEWGNAGTTGTFSGLDPDTEYDLYVRIKATENNFVSVPIKQEVRTNDHTLQKVKAEEPTCKEAGNREYWICLDCHRLFEDEQGATETDSSKVTIPAAGHTIPEQWIVEKEATKDEPGRQYKICEKCNIKIYQTIEPLGTPADLYAGKIEKEVEILSGAPDTVLNNSKEELIQSVLTEEEIAEVESGADAKIWLEVASDVAVAEEDKAQVQKAAEDSVGVGAEVMYFDASFYKQVGKEGKIPIHYTDRMVSVTIVIPESIRNKDVLMIRNYQIIRLHDGKTDILEGTYKEESAEFTFRTDRFSTYALVYRDTVKDDKTTATDVESVTKEQAEATKLPGETKLPGGSMITLQQQEKNNITMMAGMKVSQTGKKISIRWGKVKGADGYQAYVAYCGKDFTSKPAKTVKSASVTKVSVEKINGKKLNLKRNYKVYIAAYKIVNGKKVVIGKTPIGHIVGKNNYAYTNVKQIRLAKSEFTLKEGDTAKITATTVLVDKKKKQLSDAHAEQFRYATGNKKVATVSGEGEIMAAGKGDCTIYVYARNGYAKKIKVKVK